MDARDDPRVRLMHPVWTPKQHDARIGEALRHELPDRLFDAHAHLYRTADLAVPGNHPSRRGSAEVTVDQWSEGMTGLVGPHRVRGGLFFPYPVVRRGRRAAANAFLLEQLAQRPDSRGLLLIGPDDRQERCCEGARHPQIAGFKVYHTFADVQPTFDATVDRYVPEWAWEIAQQQAMAIMLHLVRSAALADPANQKYVRSRCERYPDARVILAHAARGFHALHTVHGLSALQGLENVFFDTSAICESDALTAIVEQFGPRKLMWGSDFPVSHHRGKCVTAGEGFVWLDAESIDVPPAGPPFLPTFVGLESLRALQQAMRQCGLNDDDQADVYYRNAQRMLGLCRPSADVTQATYRRARQRIPGGTQLVSKRPEMMAPGAWPAYFREARGCEVWDLDGRRYVDMSSNGIGSCLLGYAHPEVSRAVRRRVMLGSMSSLNAAEEVALADTLCEIHPWADQVRFARTGGEAAAIAVRIARATTGRTCVAICGYHGWHDWYLAANLPGRNALDEHLLEGLKPEGVPPELAGTTVAFAYNDAQAFRKIVAQHGTRLAAVIMEPCRHVLPDTGFMELIRESTRSCGALLLLDEITMGWRLCLGGAHRHMGVTPDMAVFGKALGNGHPMAAIIGTSAAMDGAHGSFISSTYWTEAAGPAAALATIDAMRCVDVPQHVARSGALVVDAWQRAGDRHDLPVRATGAFPCLAGFRFEHEHADALRTLYTQWMLDRGFLAGTRFYPTLAHTGQVVCKYTDAIDEVFDQLRQALDRGPIAPLLRDGVAHTTFQRLN